LVYLNAPAYQRRVHAATAEPTRIQLGISSALCSCYMPR
jgi:hypothetical protein